MHENGQRFPRAEIFGFERDGRETQCFLRELELYARLPCYAYPAANLPVDKGVLLSAALLLGESVNKPQRIERPAGLKRPMGAARLTWWRIPPGDMTFDLKQLDTWADPGY